MNMSNYRIWKCDEDNNFLLIEVFDECDVLSIQKEFVEKGYIIIQTEAIFGHHFIKVLKRKKVKGE